MSFEKLRDSWERRHEPRFSIMSTEKYDQWVEEDICAKQGIRIGTDDLVGDHRHSSYMQGQRNGFLWGVTWTLKTLAWIVALGLVWWYTDWA